MEKQALVKNRDSEGFKRPSILRYWEKFYMVDGFCQDVMHQIDEGVTKWLLSRLVDNCEEFTLSKAQFNETDSL